VTDKLILVMCVPVVVAALIGGYWIVIIGVIAGYIIGRVAE